ncbi:MAG TPA: glycoside hydrolase family 88 protein [Bacilli bacterium]
MTTEWWNEAWRQAHAKLSRSLERIGAGYPHASVNGKYLLEEPHWWTAGFWPGMLWLLYEASGDEKFRETAEQCEAGLDRVISEYYKLDHDIGFMWTLTSVARYKLLQAEDAKRRALLAANLLAARFNLRGRYIRAWNPWHAGEDNTGYAIIDSLMNLPLLFWASRESGDPRYRHVAEAHLDTALAHFLRSDGSVYHIVRFDPVSGACAEKLGGQGYAPESAWSRGTAWAIYGFALAYHHTGRRDFLDAAERTANFFIAHLPADKIPPWDFRLPEHVARPKDSSAGACAASGMLMLADMTVQSGAERYRAAATEILKSLYERCGTWDDPAEEGLILHGTGNFPEGQNIDVPLIYGDYFFLEGLGRLKQLQPIFWE